MQHQSFYSSSSISSFPSLNFDVSGGLGLNASFSSQVSLGSGLQGADPNTPEVFKQNIQLAQAHVSRVQGLARSALAGIEHAYHQGTSPVQTAADIASLKQALLALIEHLRHSGTGALPLDVPDTRSEDQLVSDVTRSVQGLYDRQKRIQDNASIVVGLLNMGAVGSGAGEQKPAER